MNSELKFNPPFHLGLKNTNACKLANFVLSLADQCAAHLPLPPTHAKMEKCLLPAQNPFLSSFIVFLLLFRSHFGFVFYFFFCTLHIFLICNLRTLLIFSISFVFLFVSFIIFLFLWQPSKTLIEIVQLPAEFSLFSVPFCLLWRCHAQNAGKLKLELMA